MFPAILNSIQIDNTDKFVIAQELSNYCRSRNLHVIFGATNLDIEDADAYIISTSGHQVVPVSISRQVGNQTTIYSTEDIYKVVRSISRSFALPRAS